MSLETLIARSPRSDGGLVVVMDDDHLSLTVEPFVGDEWLALLELRNHPRTCLLGMVATSKVKAVADVIDEALDKHLLG